nr:NADH dehydrogenase subunit 4L [Carapus mourlani]WNH23798.1 NADH dehydrogenase subunit 4L [Carapus mourlani]
MTPVRVAFMSAFALGLMGLALHRVHLISALLCLEAMMLTLYVTLSVWALEHTSASHMACPLILLAFSACEASAGLALLVAMSRTHGSDSLQSLNLLQC